jgi:flagellar biosynthesis/type III secretory pathway protein FliH
VRAELAEAHQLQVRMALADISAAMAEARRAAEHLATEQAEALARLVIDLVRAALPNLCARHGAAEARAMLDMVRPGLLAEPHVAIHLHPTLATALAADLAALGAVLPGEVRIAPSEALSPGDVRVAWQNGAAERDTQALIAGIDAALGAAGLWREPEEARIGD